MESLRRQTKYGAARLSAVLRDEHRIVIAPATVHRILVRKGISRVSDLDPTFQRSQFPTPRTNQESEHLNSP